MGSNSSSDKGKSANMASPNQSAYPRQGAYPVQCSAPVGYPPAGPYDAPPPYSYAGGPAPQPVYGQPVYYQQQPYIPPAQTVVVQGGFDAGARFDGVSKPNIPPPPPGCCPNVAQVAAAQGRNVVVTQREGNLWTGGSDGGMSMGF